MSNSDGPPDPAVDIVEEARAILDEAEPVASDEERPAERTRNFALGLFLVAIFLVSLAALLPEKGRWIWAGFSFVLLTVAAWYWDRVRR